MVWLFALASGAANACLLETWETHSHGAPVDGHEVSAGHTEVGGGHDADSDVSKAPCLKVCDDESHSLVKQQSGLDLSAPSMAPFVSAAWPTAIFFGSAPNRVNDLQPPEPGPPVRVRFSRLAL